MNYKNSRLKANFLVNVVYPLILCIRSPAASVLLPHRNRISLSRRHGSLLLYCIIAFGKLLPTAETSISGSPAIISPSQDLPHQIFLSGGTFLFNSRSGYLCEFDFVVFIFWSFIRDREPSLLRPATLQKHETCWAVAFTRLLEAMLRLLSPEFQDDWELSTQDMINQVRLISERTTSGHLDKLETALKRGLVRESVCPLTYALDTTELDYENDNPPRYGLRNMEIMNWFDADFDALETFVVKRLEKSPVVISIPAYDTYLNIPSNFGTGLYIPYIEEQKDFVAPAGKHLVLCTGYGVTASGVSYLEIQDTKGPRFADGGFLRIAMGCKMVREVVVMDV